MLLPSVFLTSITCTAQDSTQINKKLWSWLGVGTAYTASMSALYFQWYADYPHSSFHFFNDNQEWLQMDKCGHAYTAYIAGEYGTTLMKWAGYPKKKAYIYGNIIGFGFQSSIEIFDGFSEEWGASSGDIIANSLGTALNLGQYLLWDEQRMKLKFSFQQTNFAPLRPNTLGNSLATSLLKDYNGQTYWLSIAPAYFLKKESQFPPWLAFAFGYGANGIIGGNSNKFYIDNGLYDYSHIQRSRTFYFSPDIDLEKIPTKKKWLKTSLKILNIIKIPMPTLALENQKMKTYWLYF